MSKRTLSKQKVVEGLRYLEGWSVVKGNLHRISEFKAESNSRGPAAIRNSHVFAGEVQSSTS